MNPARRTRSGRQRAKSSATDSNGASRHRDSRRSDHRQAEGRVREVAGVRAEGHHVPVGEVDEPEDPVDERDPDGRDRVYRAGDEAVHEQLHEHGQITWGSGTSRPSSKRRSRGRQYRVVLACHGARDDPCDGGGDHEAVTAEAGGDVEPVVARTGPRIG